VGIALKKKIDHRSFASSSRSAEADPFPGGLLVERRVVAEALEDAVLHGLS
jgi:hypothetical protein